MPNQVMLNDFMKYPVDWETSLLGDVVDINPETIETGTPGTFHFKYIDISSVNLGNISWDTVTNQVLSSAPSRARRVARSEDVLFSTVRPGLQSHAYAEWPMQNYYICSTGFAILRAKRMHPRFLYHLIFSDEVSSQVRKLELGSNYPAINESDVSNLCIPIPPGAEQRRIAEILDTIDEAIKKNEALISKLKAMKQGLLQDLLTRGLDKNGKLRDPKAHPEKFKEFGLRKVPRSWTVGKLGTQLAFQRGFDITQTEQRPGNVPVVSSSGITSYHDRAMVNGPGVVTGRKGKLGQAYFIESSFWPHDTTLWVKNFHENIPRFAALFIEWLRLERFDAATSVPTLNRNFIHPMIVAMPPEYEQRQICAMAESFDNRIHTEEQYRDKFKLQKKGLMHDLLTGKVRVKV